MKQTIACYFSEDCVWGSWSEFSTCSNSCGGGTKTRTRQKIGKEKFGGLCKGSNQDTTYCNTQECPASCKLSIQFCEIEGVQKSRQTFDIYSCPKVNIQLTFSFWTFYLNHS